MLSRFAVAMPRLPTIGAALAPAFAAPARSFHGMSSSASILGNSRVSSMLNGLPVISAPARLASTESLTLSNLANVDGARKVAKRLGRGRSSGLGKTSGRGQKGQKSRSGLRSQTRFEGGQTMLWRRTPKHGFKNHTRKELDTVNVGDIVKYAAAGRIDPYRRITIGTLAKVGLVRPKHGVKVLGRGAELVSRFPVPLRIHVTHSSATVRDAVTEADGHVRFNYTSRLALHEILHPGTRTYVPNRVSVAPPKKRLRYDEQLCGKADLEKAAELRLARIVRKIRQRT